ncbi:MAG TPA: putative 2OG-Fe(II) oxygenase [Polyangia bacterium]|nr:putative 2OG-Fe(II) oxygenase [Polyangia bacterium]
MDEIFALFPIPFMRAPATLPEALTAKLATHFGAQATRDNNSSANLAHTEMLRPSDSPLLVEAAQLIGPKLVDYGVHLFGERMPWALKEVWVNVLDHGGHQAMHNHANSFVSGVVYLTPTHPGSQTVFMKSPGGTDFLFRNDHARMTPGQFSADKWISPAPQPGDLVLFPSYVLHAVPPNQGQRRITLSFNSIPARLDSWGYTLRFSG